VEVPPWDAVLRGNNAGAGSQQRSYEVAGRRQCSCTPSIRGTRCRPVRSSAGIGSRMGMGVEIAARAENGDAAAPHGLQVLAPRDQVDVRAASARVPRNVRADCPRPPTTATFTDPPGARVAGCTLPVGPFGISGRIVTCEAAWTRQGDPRSARRVPRAWPRPLSTTTTPTCSPYFSSGCGYAAASATREGEQHILYS